MGPQELKPCPWCGEQNKRNIIRRGLNGRYFIDHMDAVFHLKSSVGFAAEKEAAEPWNDQEGQEETPLDVWEKLYRARK